MVRSNRAFTLIELLVVITIIVVLLALLTPAIDRAMYQAELAVCGSKLHAAGGGVTEYAMNHHRHYPPKSADWMPSLYFRAGPATINTIALMQPYLAVNATFNCPLNPVVDFEGSKPGTTVLGDYNMWFGYRYQANGSLQNSTVGGAIQWEQGMLKVGDRFTWAGDSFDLLATDQDGVGNNGIEDVARSSHPDLDGVMAAEKEQDVTGSPTYTLSWMRVLGASQRGALDLNYLHGDLAVSRLNDVKWNEPDLQGGRTVRVPDAADSRTPAMFYHLPVR